MQQHVLGNYLRSKMDYIVEEVNKLLMGNNEEEQETKYRTGHYIVVADVLTVRSTPKMEENNWLRYSQLTSNAQKQIYEKSRYKPNGLVKGVECDVSEIKQADGYTWGKIPSGWIALEYCKKGE